MRLPPHPRGDLLLKLRLAVLYLSPFTSSLTTALYFSELLQQVLALCECATEFSLQFNGKNLYLPDGLLARGGINAAEGRFKHILVVERGHGAFPRIDIDDEKIVIRVQIERRQFGIVWIGGKGGTRVLALGGGTIGLGCVGRDAAQVEVLFIFQAGRIVVGFVGQERQALLSRINTKNAEELADLHLRIQKFDPLAFPEILSIDIPALHLHMVFIQKAYRNRSSLVQLTEYAIDIHAPRRDRQIGVIGGKADSKAASCLWHTALPDDVQRLGLITVLVDGLLLVPIGIQLNPTLLHYNANVVLFGVKCHTAYITHSSSPVLRAGVSPARTIQLPGQGQAQPVPYTTTTPPPV